MGAAACQVIVLEGNVAYGTVEEFSSDHPQVSTAKLEAAVEASCQAILHASLYFAIKGEYKLTSEYTQPIIDAHERVKNELPTVSNQDAQALVDELTGELLTATRRTIELFD